MKSKTLELIKLIFISYEFVTTVLIIVLYFLFGNTFARIGEYILNTKIIFDSLGYFMVGFLLFSLTYSWKILKPKANNKILYQWNDYWKIKITTFVSVLIILCCNVVYYLTLFLKTEIERDVLALLIILVVINSLITIVSLFLAAFSINEILDSNM